MEETKDYSKNVVFKEYALPHIILFCIYTLLHLGFAFVPVITIVDGSRDLQSPIAAYIIGGVLSLMLLLVYNFNLFINVLYLCIFIIILLFYFYIIINIPLNKYLKTDIIKLIR